MAYRSRRIWPLVFAFAAIIGAGSWQVLPSAEASAGRAGIDWGSCPDAPAGITPDPKQTCATLRVPLDYRHPNGRTVEIAVSRIPATDPAKRRGVLLLNPGGPGGEGLNLPSLFAQRLQISPEVLATYDRIGFDPRGVAHSTPVTCGLTAAEMVPNLPFPAPDGSIEANIAFARSAAARCAGHSGDLLPFITTANTARDMDRIREALGEEQVSYWGGSYGTYLGTVYASLFPRRTDRIVLDSAADPTKVWYDFFRLQGAGMTTRFPDAARYAAEHADTIKFGATVDQVTRSHLDLAGALDAHPLAIAGSPVRLTGNVFRFITFSLLYRDTNIPVLAETWRAAADLNAGTATSDQIGLLRAVIQELTPGNAGSPAVPADNSVAAAWAVVCGDVRWPTDVRRYARNVAADRKRYPLTAGFAANLWPCAFWPTEPIERPVIVSDRGPRNILILQNERDPATPLTAARGLHRALGSRSVLVTVDAGGHGVYGKQGAGACATVAADEFLVNGTLPAGDLNCPSPQ